MVSTIKRRITQKALIKSTSYEQFAYQPVWPIPLANNLPNSYFLRLVLEPEIFVGEIAYQELYVRAWNYANYQDANGKLQRVAIPRAWHNPEQQKIFFLTSPNPGSIASFSDKFIKAIVSKSDEVFGNKQRMVGAFFAPTDPDIDPALRTFYISVATQTLPMSFVTTGAVTDLPNLPGIGPFLPITQLMFDVSK